MITETSLKIALEILKRAEFLAERSDDVEIQYQMVKLFQQCEDPGQTMTPSQVADMVVAAFIVVRRHWNQAHNSKPMPLPP